MLGFGKRITSEENMAKTTVRPGNPYIGEGGRMPSTTGSPSGGNRGNNPPSSPASGHGNGGKK